jgi:ATP-dependent Clp protease ATP-binding subunit ClpA
LRRALQKYLEDPLADEILKGQFAGDCEVLVDKEQEEKLSFKVVVGAHPLQSKEFVA